MPLAHFLDYGEIAHMSLRILAFRDIFQRMGVSTGEIIFCEYYYLMFRKSIMSVAPGTLDTEIYCSATFNVSESNPDVEVDYVLFAFSGYSHLPNSTSVLGIA